MIKIKTGRNILMSFVLLMSITFTTIVYSAYNTQLQIKGDAVLRSNQEIRITKLELTGLTNGAFETYNSKYEKDTVSIYATLPANSSLTYEVSITNKTTIDYELVKINTLSNSNSNVIITTNLVEGAEVEKNSNKSFNVTFRNNTTSQQLITFINQYIFEECKPPIIQLFSSGDTTKFRSDEYREKIKTINLSNVISEPSGVVASWNLGVNENDNVKGYLTVNPDVASMYDLYIQGDEGLIANSNSGYLFGGLTNLEKINNLNILDTSNVTNMYLMFSGDSKLVELDLKGFDTSKVTSMDSMFSYCSSLQSLDVSNFDTSNVKMMNHMFDRCSSLVTLDLREFNTPNLNDVQYMFYNCARLESVIFSNKFDTSKLWGMAGMFSVCSSLKEIDLSMFEVNGANMTNMFSYCGNLTKIYVGPKWSIDNVVYSSNMFTACWKLSGAVSFDSSKVDASMANYTTGYLTYKT